MADESTPDVDRIVRSLIEDLPKDGVTLPVDGAALAAAAALVLRVVRDDLTLDWMAGNVRDVESVLKYLNGRIDALVPGRPDTMTGDTTVPGYAGYRA